MSKRLPDEFFRQTTSESTDIREATNEPAQAAERSRLRRSAGIPVRLVVASAVAAILVGYTGVRVAVQQTADQPVPTPSITSSSTSANLAPYDGAVQPVVPLTATGNCTPGPDLAPALLDSSADTVWRCPGDGLGEKITFTFNAGTEVVGVRLVNGSLSDGVYQDERRILALRWTFGDGSWVVQPLAANQPGEQEVRFPPVTTSAVEMEVLASTDPGNDYEASNAVTIGRLEFLTGF